MKKRLFSIVTAALMLLSLSACSAQESSSIISEPEVSELTSSVFSSETESTASDEQTSFFASSEPSLPNASETDPSIRVGALKGPTAMGMAKMMDDHTEDDSYSFTMAAAPDQLTPLILQNEVDIAAVPANLASVLYNKTEGKIKVISINTLGVLYIVENGETVNTVEDLRGKTIFASGKGATPEYALNYMLEKNGINPATDVTIEFKAEHAECVSAVTTTDNSVAMLPEPFVTTALSKNDQIHVRLDLNAEWETLVTEYTDSPTLVTGVTVVREEFLIEYPELVAKFLAEQSASVQFVNQSIDEAAELMEQFDIVPAAVAKNAIPKCNITFIDGTAMQTSLSTYLDILNTQNPQSIGGALPDEAFYYLGNS